MSAQKNIIHSYENLIEDKDQEIENLKSKVQYWKGFHK